MFVRNEATFNGLNSWFGYKHHIVTLGLANTEPILASTPEILSTLNGFCRRYLTA
ncbi:MAG: hypothetical protein ACTH7Q_12500 [Pseudoalteromonas sp.]